MNRNKTVGEMIEKVIELTGTGHDEETLAGWLSEIEGHVQLDVMGLGEEDVRVYSYEDDRDVELVLGSPWDRIYRFYLMAMICLADEESTGYANNKALYEDAYRDFKSWYINRYRVRRAT